MRHYNEREGAFAVWYGHVAVNGLAVSRLISDVFNLCELIVLKIGFGATDLGDLSVADKVVSPGSLGPELETISVLPSRDRPDMRT